MVFKSFLIFSGAIFGYVQQIVLVYFFVEKTSASRPRHSYKLARKSSIGVQTSQLPHKYL